MNAAGILCKFLFYSFLGKLLQWFSDRQLEGKPLGEALRNRLMAKLRMAGLKPWVGGNAILLVYFPRVTNCKFVRVHDVSTQ